MSNKFLKASLAILLCFLLGSCAGGSNPSGPDLELKNQPDRVPYGSPPGLWGLWDVSIDPSGEYVEIVPIRGPQFTANVTVFMQPPKGSTTNLGIEIIDASRFFTQGLIDIDITINHPFPGLDMFTGFDVMGVFISNGDTIGNYDGNVKYATGSATPVLLNADGYTRWYNPVEFTSGNLFGYLDGALGTPDAGFNATLNPFRYFCDGLGSQDELSVFFQDLLNAENRGKFGPGTNKRRYELNFPVYGGMPDAKFQYAIVANWEMPMGDPPYEAPDDWSLSANRAEGIHLSVLDVGSDLWWENGEGGGTIRCRAEFWDWGGMVNPDGVLGEINQVIVESDDVVMPASFTVMPASEFAPYVMEGTAGSSVALLEFTGVEPLHDGEVKFFVTIESSYPVEYEQGFDVPVAQAPLASYFFVTFPVGPKLPCTPPGAVLDAPDAGMVGEEILFDASSSTGTPPLSFMWDWDGDGTYDETTPTGIVTHVFTSGVWLVGLKVVNDCGEDVLDPSHEITINCPDEVYSTKLGTIQCQGNFTNISTDGIAFLPDGRAMVKSGDQLLAYDVTVPGSVAGEVIIDDLANATGEWCYLANLDYDEVWNRILYSTIPDNDELVNVYFSDGTYFTEFLVPGSGGVLAGMDTDGEGGVWCMYHTPGGATGTNTLYHFAYNPVIAMYDLQAQDTLDCTFVNDGKRGIYDIAVMWEAQRLYVIHGYFPDGGAVYAIDISTTPPTHLSDLTKTDIFSADVTSSIDDYHKFEGGTIEVDHADGLIENCRLIAHFCFQTNGDGIGMVKYDAELNELDRYRVAGTRLNGGAIRWAENPEERFLVLPGRETIKCTLHVFEAPPGW